MLRITKIRTTTSNMVDTSNTTTRVGSSTGTIRTTILITITTCNQAFSSSGINTISKTIKALAFLLQDLTEQIQICLWALTTCPNIALC
tara:strand:+ start:224 stop:490 length:267 start_codon:yes stop_codon:yes gene_type:complete